MKKKVLQILSLPIGMILLGIGITIGRYLPQNNTSDFLTGFLVGLSIVLNLYYIFTTTKKKKDQ